jgi:hypothetical protein
VTEVRLKEEIPVNDRNPPGRFDSVLVTWWTMLPSFTSPSQPVDRLVRLAEAQRRSMNVKGTDFVRDERDERLERAGYLLVVYVHRVFHCAAAFILVISRRAMKQLSRWAQAIRSTVKQSEKLTRLGTDPGARSKGRRMS